MAPNHVPPARKPRPWRWTRAHLVRLPDDGNRYEVLDGALLVTPQAEAWHNEVALRFAIVLREFCEKHGIGSASCPASVVFGASELQPDVMVTPARIGPGQTWKTLPRPLLVIEVLSPGSERHDLHRKRGAYLGLGIPAYWVVNLDARQLLEFRLGGDEPTVFSDSLTWQPAGAPVPLVIDLRTLLAT